MLTNVALATREGLGPEELWLLARYAEGWSRDEMAAHIGVGPRLVQASLEAAFRKLGARSRTQAATLVIALQRGLLGLDVGQAV